MTCREVTDVLDRYLDGELPTRENLGLKLHLFFCPACRNYLRSYKATVRAAKNALMEDDSPPPSDMPEELVKAILAARRRMQGK
jgi:anti-sigma factor RsiW